MDSRLIKAKILDILAKISPPPRTFEEAKALVLCAFGLRGISDSSHLADYSNRLLKKVGVSPAPWYVGALTS